MVLHLDDDMLVFHKGPFSVVIREAQDLFDELERHEKIEQQPWIRSRHQVSIDQLADTSFVEGDRRLKEIEWALETMSKTRSTHQKRFQRSFLNASLPHVYGYAEWPLHKTRVMQERGIEHIYMGVLAMTERRFGKTHCAAQLMTGFLYVVPQLETLVFSQGKRSSGNDGFMGITHHYLCNLPMGAERIISHNQETMKIGFGMEQAAIFPEVSEKEARKRMKMDVANVSVMHSLPASGDKLRGVSGQIIFIEEAAYVDPKTFLTVIVPLMKIQHSTILGISSPGDRFNYYSALFLSTDEFGNQLFEQLTIDKICGACQERQAPDCPHTKFEAPDWNPIGRARTVAHLLKDNPEMLQREAQGIVATDAQPVFKPAWIAALKTRETHVFDERFPFETVYVGIDPSKGAARDGYAMNMIVYDAVHGMECPVILGSDVSKSQSLDDVVRMVIDRLSMANRHPNRSRKSACAYAMIIEANTGYFDVQGLLKHAFDWAAQERQKGFMTFIYPFSRDTEKANRAGVHGVWTSAAEKRNLCHDMQHCLSHGALSFAKQYVAGSPNDPGAVEREKDALLTELMNIREETLWPKTFQSEIKHWITGKSGKKSDDRWMALSLAYTNSLRLREGSESTRFRSFLMSQSITRA